MLRFRTLAQTLRMRFFPAFTKDQANLLAAIKLPCC
jgi:hypothetical protein